MLTAGGVAAPAPSPTAGKDGVCTVVTAGVLHAGAASRLLTQEPGLLQCCALAARLAVGWRRRPSQASAARRTLAAAATPTTVACEPASQECNNPSSCPPGLAQFINIPECIRSEYDPDAAPDGGMHAALHKYVTAQQNRTQHTSKCSTTCVRLMKTYYIKSHTRLTTAHSLSTSARSFHQKNEGRSISDSVIGQSHINIAKATDISHE